MKEHPLEFIQRDIIDRVEFQKESKEKKPLVWIRFKGLKSLGHFFVNAAVGQILNGLVIEGQPISVMFSQFAPNRQLRIKTERQQSRWRGDRDREEDAIYRKEFRGWRSIRIGEKGLKKMKESQTESGDGLWKWGDT